MNATYYLETLAARLVRAVSKKTGMSKNDRNDFVRTMAAGGFLGRSHIEAEP